MWGDGWMGRAAVCMWMHGCVTRDGYGARGVRCRHVYVVWVMFAIGDAVVRVQTTGATPLWIACQGGDQAMAGLLLDRGADVNLAEVRWLAGQWLQVTMRMGFGGHVCEWGTAGTVGFWMQVCVCFVGVVVVVCLQTASGATPLWIACEEGHQAVAGLLLDRGADVNQAEVRQLAGPGQCGVCR
jgi:ankyrin repeat protein